MGFAAGILVGIVVGALLCLVFAMIISVSRRHKKMHWHACTVDGCPFEISSTDANLATAITQTHKEDHFR